MDEQTLMVKAAECKTKIDAVLAEYNMRFQVAMHIVDGQMFTEMRLVPLAPKIAVPKMMPRNGGIG
jgi:hypothetical protein